MEIPSLSSSLKDGSHANLQIWHQSFCKLHCHW